MSGNPSVREVALSTPTIPETPGEKRERLRGEVRARGFDPCQIESITGNCDVQIAQQISDLETWFVRS